MPLILGIETSCDEAAAAVFDTAAEKILSSVLFSQIEYHRAYGGVVPEIASRSQLEKIDIIIEQALKQANTTLNDIDTIAVTNKPGLVGSLLVGVCFAKGIAWAHSKNIIGINHLEGHIFSSFLQHDGSVNKELTFPFITLSASGGHTALYLVHNFGEYELIGHTQDDAAGEAFDKISKILGLGYPGGAIIEKLAKEVDFKDFFSYPRPKMLGAGLDFSFSGLKTAILYDLVKKGAYNLATGPVQENITHTLRQHVSSSLLVCVGAMFQAHVKRAFERYPQAKNFAFVGGVACNAYLRQQLGKLCSEKGKKLFASPPIYSTDNGAMIAFVGGYKARQGAFSTLSLDVLKD